MSIFKDGGFIDGGNSTSSVLGISGVFTGEWAEVFNYSEMTIIINADVASSSDGLQMQFSTDAVNVDREKKVSVGTSGATHTLVHIARYFRIVYTNGTTGQATFRMQTIHHQYKSKDLTSTLDQTLSNDSDLQLTRAVIVAQKPDSTFANVQSDQFATLSVNLGTKNTTVFGELTTSRNDPIIQELFTYSVNPRTWFLTNVNGGTITQANAMVVVGTSTTTASTSTLESRKHIQYKSGMGVMVRFSAIFTSPVEGTSQIIGLGDVDDGLFVGYNNLLFGVLHRNSASGSIVDTWYYQTAWSDDLGNGTQSLPVMDWTKGNVFQISFQYLGMGEIQFFVEEPESGEFRKVHHIAYANANTVPSMQSPSLPLCVMVDNQGTTSDIIIKSSSMSAFIEGTAKRHGFTNSVSNSKASIGATETNIITIRNRSTFNTYNNKNLIYPNLVSIATISGTKPTTIQVILNTTLGGSPSYTMKSTDESLLEYDIAGTTVSGGDVIMATVLGKEDRVSFNLADIDVFLDPADTLTFTAVTTAGSVEVFTSCTIREDV